jgi:hypothetical protein
VLREITVLVRKKKVAEAETAAIALVTELRKTLQYRDLVVVLSLRVAVGFDKEEPGDLLEASAELIDLTTELGARSKLVRAQRNRALILGKAGLSELKRKNSKAFATDFCEAAELHMAVGRLDLAEKSLEFVQRYYWASKQFELAKPIEDQLKKIRKLTRQNKKATKSLRRDITSNGADPLVLESS